MQFIEKYISDSSSDDENTPKTVSSSKPYSCQDYFCLQKDDSDEDLSCIHPEELDVRVYTDSFNLADVEYGPGKEVNDHPKQKFSRQKGIPSSTVRKCGPNGDQQSSSKKLKSSSSGGGKLERNLPLFSDDAAQRFEGKCRIPNRRSGELKGHGASVSSLEWSGANLLLSSSLDGSVRIWDAGAKNCLYVVQKQRAGVKKAMWFYGSNQVISAGFDKTVVLTDVTSGNVVCMKEHSSYVTSLQKNEAEKNTFLAGCKDCIVLWDLRMQDPVHKYRSSCGQILDILMLPDNLSFVCSTELVSRESANRTLLAFDLRSTALLSNQIYQERYTCPCLRMGATSREFLAQSNAGYIAIFSTNPPYKLNKYKRYEGHKVLGYSVGFDLSADKKWIMTGDAEGLLYYYNTWTAESQTVGCSEHPTVSVAWNPFFASSAAIGTWNGEIQLWK